MKRASRTSKAPASIKEKKGLRAWMPLIKGLLVAIIFTVAAILAFALLIKTGVLGEGAIAPVNQVIKITGIIIAAFITARRETSHVWLKGGAAGAAYLLLGWLIFSMIEGAFGSVTVLLVDMMMGLIIGAIIGIAVPRVKKQAKAGSGA